MKNATFLFLFIILFLGLSTAYCINIPISTIKYNWELTGELTNTNPYSVFVVTPTTGSVLTKQLNSPENYMKVTINDISNNTIVGWTSSETILNGKPGFWIPPYTTYKTRIRGEPKILDMLVDNSQLDYNTYGPGLVSEYRDINPKTLFPLYKKGIKLNNFRLFVYGSIQKTENTEVLSLVVPAPVVLNNYYRFNKIIKENEVDIWQGTYNSYLKKQNKITYKMNPELYDVDNSLVPITENTLGQKTNLKLLDVPIMTFTTSENMPIPYAYTMYWDNN